MNGLSQTFKVEQVWVQYGVNQTYKVPKANSETWVDYGFDQTFKILKATVRLGLSIGLARL